MQQHSLLQTKLYVPPIRPEWVWRLHLIEWPNVGMDFDLEAVTLTYGTEDQNEGITLSIVDHPESYTGEGQHV